jgi:ribosomal-protein-serine acetyltransferase
MSSQAPIPDTLTDGVLTLHRLRMEDVPDLFAAARESVATINPWLPWCHEGYKIEDAEGWIATQVKAWDARTSFEFCFRTVAGEHVGGGGINNLDVNHPMANLGYWIRSSQERKGYATRAARLLAWFGLRDVGLQRIELQAAAGNAASLRVMEKLGAHREGILRNRLCIHGVMHDAVGHSLVPADLERMLAEPVQMSKNG